MTPGKQGNCLKKKLAVFTTSIMLGLGNVIAIPAVKADTIDMKHQKLEQAKSSVAKNQDGVTRLSEQIKKVDEAIKENNQLIGDNENQIHSLTAEVSQLQQEIALLNERIEKRSEILKSRAKSFQETGGDVSYLDVLLGASSFGDLVDRINTVATLVQADNDLLKEHQADKQEVEQKQGDVQKKLAELNAKKAELEAMKSEYADQKAQNEVEKARLNEALKSGNAQIASLTADLNNVQATAYAAIEQGVQQVKATNISNHVNVAVNTTMSTTAVTQNRGSGGINSVIRAGYKYIGNSVYVFGGGRTASDIAAGRFDCSGFVHWAFAQAGISVGSSTDSLKGAGTQVSVSQIQPGDMVFFNTYKTDGHVGIYIGGGKFIGSQSSTGVAIANMSSGYWAQHFNGRVVRVM